MLGSNSDKSSLIRFKLVTYGKSRPRTQENDTEVGEDCKGIKDPTTLEVRVEDTRDEVWTLVRKETPRKEGQRPLTVTRPQY